MSRGLAYTPRGVDPTILLWTSDQNTIFISIMKYGAEEGATRCLGDVHEDNHLALEVERFATIEHIYSQFGRCQPKVKIIPCKVAKTT